MLVFVLNSGSSSIKYRIINAEDERLITKGVIERVGQKDSIYSFTYNGNKKQKIVTKTRDYEDAMSLIFKTIQQPEYNIIGDISEIKAIGHRVVHGGEKFTSAAYINDDVIHEIKDCIELAPLHNPANLKGIEVCKKLLPDVPQVAVFDTAFHQTMPAISYLYGLPYIMYLKYKIRRYGFHGTSHKYVSMRAAKMLGRELEDVNLITCHLGNGASVAAIKNGKSIDTSMGFTPLEGLIMGTRSGDLDPAIVLYIMSKQNLTIDEANSLLNKHSGLLGISGISNDMSTIIQLMNEGDRRGELAVNIFAYRLKKYIGAYYAALGSVDAIVFTAGIGENVPIVREKAVEGLENLGIVLDREKNMQVIAVEDTISSDESKIKIFVIPTNEELLIAMETKRIVEEMSNS